MKTIETVIAERVDGLSRFEFQDAVRAAELAALACAVATLRAESERAREVEEAAGRGLSSTEARCNTALATIARLMGIDAEDAK